MVAPGTPIASLQSVSPIHADFWLPQQALAELKAGQRVRVRTDALPDASWDGEITAVNPEVDVATRNVRVRATVRNADGRLRPGMFANVEVLSEERSPVLVIPATAVIFAPYGDSVFAIEEKKDESRAAPRRSRARSSCGSGSGAATSSRWRRGSPRARRSWRAARSSCATAWPSR